MIPIKRIPFSLTPTCSVHHSTLGVIAEVFPNIYDSPYVSKRIGRVKDGIIYNSPHGGMPIGRIEKKDGVYIVWGQIFTLDNFIPIFLIKLSFVNCKDLIPHPDNPLFSRKSSNYSYG